MSRTQNAITNTFFGLLLKLYQAVLPFVVRTVMLRTIGIEYLGLNGLFTSVLQTLSIAELGISGAITFSMYKPIAQGDTERVCALLRLYRLSLRRVEQHPEPCQEIIHELTPLSRVSPRDPARSNHGASCG